MPDTDTATSIVSGEGAVDTTQRDNDPGEPRGRRFRGSFALILVAIIAIVGAAVWGIAGLGKNPIEGTDASGATIISGTFEPYQCTPRCNDGYVQAGARSVFVILPLNCPAPASGHDVTIHGRLDPTQGSQTYRATACATAA